VLDCEARYLRGEALRAEAELDKVKERSQSLREQAVTGYRAYLSACGERARNRRQAQSHTATLLDALGRSAEALLIWRRLYLEAPTEAVGTQAARRLEQPGTKQAPFSAAELLERALVLFEEMRNPESEAALLLVLEQPDLDDNQKCIARYHLAQSVFKQRQRPRAAPLFDQAIIACAPAAAKNDDLHMKSLYQGARCHASAGRLQKGAELFAQAEAAHPTHSYADDSRLRQAEMFLDLAEKLVKDGPKKTCEAEQCPDYEAKFEALLAELPVRYPEGDRRAEALWRLAFRALRKKDAARAQTWLTSALEKIPREVGWDQEGRTLYWLARLAEQSGDRPAALNFYQRTARTYPLSFYTLLTLNRLRLGFSSEFEALLRELYGEPRDEPLRFAPRPLYGMPGFVRGIELLRLGLGAEARREFVGVGIVVPETKDALAGKDKDPAQTELLWLASVLYERAGDWHRSHFIPRHILQSWQQHYPVGGWRSQWQLAYPRGYADLLTAAAQQNGQPEALQFAIVREESAFDPLTESFANAIGLTQMIPPTAKRFANGLPYDRQALRDPATNVAIGSRFLGFLWQTMSHHPALTISGYNAGEGAVWRWLRSFAELQEIDLFIEAIPYDETRGYTKRVLSSFLTYSWLAPLPAGTPPSARVPELPMALPSPPGKASPKVAPVAPPSSAATVAPTPAAASPEAGAQPDPKGAEPQR
jgi:soluble lytic murein transglycosylase